MYTDEPLYQIGICPDCSADAEQRLLFARDPEWFGPITEGGQIVAYELIEALSLFTCQRCCGALLYSTQADLRWGRGASVDEELDVYWIVKITPAQFLEDSTLLWPIKREVLPSSVPANIRKIYDGALKVKTEPNSFAVQIRRALEAICVDRGEPGKHLKDELEKLSKAGVFPPIVAEIAHELRVVGNTGAHAKSHVEDKQTQAIDDFVQLVVNYVYETPARLEAYRKLLRPKTKFILLDGSLPVN
jgi:hypothetical protein